MYVKAVQIHNPLVDMMPFGKLLFVVLVSSAFMMIWGAGALEFVTEALHPQLPRGGYIPTTGMTVGVSSIYHPTQNAII